MAATQLWPGGLPDRPTRQFNMQWPQLHEDFQPDIGPPKTRRRTSSGVAKLQTVWELTGEQVTELEDFYLNTLQGGSLSFAGVHPRTGNWSPEMWMGPPNIGEPKGDDQWMVSFELRLKVGP